MQLSSFALRLGQRETDTGIHYRNEKMASSLDNSHHATTLMLIIRFELSQILIFFNSPLCTPRSDGDMLVYVICSVSSL